jgi:hypothetical protein
VASTLRTILRNNLTAIVGDAALTDDEKNAKQLLQLTIAGQQQRLPTNGDDAIRKLSQEQSATNIKETNNSGNETWVPESSTGDKSKKKSVFVI